MAAKKKKKRLDATLMPFFLPGATFTPLMISDVTDRPLAPPLDSVQVLPEEYMSVARAWLEYTGLPSMIGGGLGALGFNVAFQAGQVKSGTSLFTAARFGFGLALLLEASIGTAIFATVLTVLDPQDLHAGGLTNEPIGKTIYDKSPSKQIEQSDVPSIWKHIWLSGQ